MGFIIFLIALIFFYFIGSWVEDRHYNSILIREKASVSLPVLNLSKIPDMNNTLAQTWLVTGSAVISMDYFKKIAASIKGIFGGRIGVFESLLDRARREAILRMKDNAGDCDMILNIRLETCSIGKSASNGNGTGCVEVLAYGTAARLRNR
ncbi:MAG: hypothetical protein CVV64_07340 [Candidatus Wallbacteria bacterium HGW-Wallbacteria-1]|jgi:uncharacterized protein YbjQ (UPF0145 family)|uniref:Uncharacterized protein n=1 Tax=Candidatus Wallbacteria bacterium HGW-Wallbacteria-1 TaxID=2013854 RepID=A0A2N1PQR5_9BACT|nr:MAG: hypothetical protein CVV64_07340 [Candidatus Wallbacteria bacterium HGW-Wallbacteria-1]